MATQIRDGYLLPQVWVTKNATKVLEILGRLTPARVEYAENIFGGERYLSKNAEKKRDYSILTMIISEGEGSTRKYINTWYVWKRCRFLYIKRIFGKYLTINWSK